MTTSHDDPARIIEAYLAAFNTGDATALESVYEPGGVLVPRPGIPVTGPGRTTATAYLLSLGIPMRAELRHSYVAGDIALLIVDWSVSGTSPDGAEIDISGTAADVAHRGADGVWRYVIDNPTGTA
jgi:ketosteroid isomerase-like protein